MTGILIPTASEAEWLEARRHGVTASEIAVILGLSPGSQNSPYSLFHRKVGNLPEQPDNDAMERGRVLEPYVVRKFMERKPEFGFGVEGDGRQLFAHIKRRWQMATPDRLLMGDSPVLADYLCCDLHRPGFAEAGGMAPCCDTNDCGPCCEACPTCPTANGANPAAVLETKTDGGYEWGEEGTSDIPVHYRCQVLWQCDVLGVGHWYLACLFMQRWQVKIYEGIIDAEAEADLKLMREEARDFLDRIDLCDPPDVDWRPATTAALKRLNPSLEDRATVIPKRMALAYRAACTRHKTAEAAKRRLENQIRERLGSASAAVLRDGTRVATRQKYTVTEKKIRDPYEVDKLVPAKNKDHT